MRRLRPVSFSTHIRRQGMAKLSALVGAALAIAVASCSAKVVPDGSLVLVLSTDLSTPEAFDQVNIEIGQETIPGNFVERESRRQPSRRHDELATRQRAGREQGWRRSERSLRHEPRRQRRRSRAPSFCLQAGSGDYSGVGPYNVATMNVDLASTGELPDAGATTYVIYYPTTLEATCPHPIVAWGNGTGVSGSTTYGFFNTNAASWGMVVAASDNPNAGTGAYQKAGIDYLLAQNELSGSVFFHKLASRAGLAGHRPGRLCLRNTREPTTRRRRPSQASPRATRARSSSCASTPRGPDASWQTTPPRAECSRAGQAAASAAIRTGHRS
jgi:hypothetical protein